MEIWDVYDAEGNLTGETAIRGNQLAPGQYHLVCDVLVRHADGSYLCMKWSREKDIYPGYWEATAGGSALRGETALDCVRRELLEETGIHCDTFIQVNSGRFDDRHYISRSYVCTVSVDKDTVRMQEGETEDYCWMTEGEFVDFLNGGRVIPTSFNRYRDYYEQLGYLK
jgi:8-oxo-dGTP pyrophosphatase MutT (NUDIX family)